ncbi:MAG: GcrA family cell cycle regulator [Caulobacterales bacterium]
MEVQSARAPEEFAELARAAEPMRMTLLGWNDEAVQSLVRLAGKGLTAAAISRQLGVTRNAVVGKLSRLGVKLGSDSPSGGLASPVGASAASGRLGAPIATPRSAKPGWGARRGTTVAGVHRNA